MPAIPKNSDSGIRISAIVCSRDTFPPWRSDVVVLFFKELSLRGHRFDWVLKSKDRCDGSYTTTWHGSKVFVGKNADGRGGIGWIKGMLSHVFHEFNLIKIAGTGDYNVVQVKDRFFAAMIGLFAARLAKQKFVFWLSFDYAQDDRQRARAAKPLASLFFYLRAAYIQFLLEIIILPRSDHIFAQSERMKQDLMALGADSDQITPVPMGVEREVILRKNTQPVQEYCICYLGTLSRTRSIHFLIDVLVRVKQDWPAAYLLLVGAGQLPEDEEFLLNYADSMGVRDSVEITGQLPQSQAWKKVQEAGVCVSPFKPTPSLISCSPTKLVEYMALGKVVVANDIPDQKLLVENSGGGICVRYDVEDFATAIIAIMADPVAARVMGDKGREYILSHRTYEHLASLVENVFQKLLTDDATISER